MCPYFEPGPDKESEHASAARRKLNCFARREERKEGKKRRKKKELKKKEKII